MESEVEENLLETSAFVRGIREQIFETEFVIFYKISFGLLWTILTKIQHRNCTSSKQVKRM